MSDIVIKIKKCDLCGYEIRDGKNKHWTDSIGKAVISFKDVAGCQSVPFDGDLCMTCANSLRDKIEPLLKEMRKQKEASRLPSADEQGEG